MSRFAAIVTILLVSPVFAQEAPQDPLIAALGQEFQASGIQQHHLAVATEALVKEYQRIKAELDKLKADAKKDKP